MSPQTTPSLDHLILFLPSSPSTSLPSLPRSIPHSFTLTPGGTHADLLTSNTLILLADGCYIELICFLPHSPSSPLPAAERQEKVKRHWWGPDEWRKGWTDWCLTNALGAGESWEGVRGSHGEPVRGGRKRADGVEVKWAVTFPRGELGGQSTRGRVPFYCHDETPRSVRVPLSDESTRHACGALGVRRLTVVVRDRQVLEETREIYRSLFGAEGVEKGDEVVFEAERVVEVDGLKGGAQIVLRVAQRDVEKERVKERGFWYGDVVLAAKAGEGKEVGKKVRLDGGDDDVGGLWIEYV